MTQSPLSAEGVEQSRLLATPVPGPRSQALAERQAASVPAGVATTMPVYAARAAGGIVEDVDGNRLIDLGAGIAVTSVGASHPRVVQAVQEQVADFTHTCFMVTPYEGYVAVAEKLSDVAPISGETRTGILGIVIVMALGLVAFLPIRLGAAGRAASAARSGASTA